MGKAFTAYMTGGAWLCLGFDFVGWVLLLAGVASMQQACGGSGANALNGVENGGGAGYNGPVSCNTFFGYTWWITFYDLGFLVAGILTLMYGLKKFRPGIVALAAIVVMQSTVAANTYISYNQLTVTSLFQTRAQVATAGAIIKAIAAMVFICCIGARDESVTLFEPAPKRTAKSTAEPPPGPPVSQNPLVE